MAQVRITQVKSSIKRTAPQKATLRALGLGKINRVATKEVTPQILGQLRAVSHLIKVEEV